MSRSMLECKATINYKNKAGQDTSMTGSGRNKHDDRSPLTTFQSFGLNKLANVRKITNPPGQCAEPHAVANALTSVGKDNIQEINSIEVTAAKFIRKAFLNHKLYEKDDIYPRCETCLQWLPDNGDQSSSVIKEYLEIKPAIRPAAVPPVELPPVTFRPGAPKAQKPIPSPLPKTALGME